MKRLEHGRRKERLGDSNRNGMCSMLKDAKSVGGSAETTFHSLRGEIARAG